MREGVLVTDGTGRLVLANRALRKMVKSNSKLVGQYPIEAIRNDRLSDLLSQVLRNGEPSQDEIQLGGLDVRTLRVTAASLTHAETKGVVAVLNDVTDLRRLERVRRDFVANVSHELRTPIAAIRAASETLQDGALKNAAVAEDFVDIIFRHAKRLQELVEDLLELSRIDAKRLSLQMEIIDAKGLMESVVELHEQAASSKNIHLNVVGAEPSALVFADQKTLERVISNLIENAIKYSQEGDTVWISAENHAAKQTRLIVKDTGPGIESYHLPRLFERFYRADKGRSRAVGGTGLGLSIVKNLVEAMGGEVAVQSEIGHGSTFTVTLSNQEIRNSSSEYLKPV
jgi:two-component system, OmpR family, phosphate regulon sensor histidine kinase PhoR